MPDSTKEMTIPTAETHPAIIRAIQKRDLETTKLLIKSWEAIFDNTNDQIRDLEGLSKVVGGLKGWRDDLQAELVNKVAGRELIIRQLEDLDKLESALRQLIGESRNSFSKN